MESNNNPNMPKGKLVTLEYNACYKCIACIAARAAKRSFSVQGLSSATANNQTTRKKMNKNRWAETNSIFRLLHWNFLFGFWFFGRIYDERKTFELHSKELQHMHTHYTPYNTYTSSDGLFVYFYVFSFSVVAAVRSVVRVKREIGTALSAAHQLEKRV